MKRDHALFLKPEAAEGLRVGIREDRVKLVNPDYESVVELLPNEFELFKKMNGSLSFEELGSIEEIGVFSPAALYRLIEMLDSGGMLKSSKPPEREGLRIPAPAIIFGVIGKIFSKIDPRLVMIVLAPLAGANYLVFRRLLAEKRIDLFSIGGDYAAGLMVFIASALMLAAITEIISGFLLYNAGGKIRRAYVVMRLLFFPEIYFPKQEKHLFSKNKQLSYEVVRILGPAAIGAGIWLLYLLPRGYVEIGAVIALAGVASSFYRASPVYSSPGREFIDELFGDPNLLTELPQYIRHLLRPNREDDFRSGGGGHIFALVASLAWLGFAIRYLSSFLINNAPTIGRKLVIGGRLGNYIAAAIIGIVTASLLSAVLIRLAQITVWSLINYLSKPNKFRLRYVSFPLLLALLISFYLLSFFTWPFISGLLITIVAVWLGWASIRRAGQMHRLALSLSLISAIHAASNGGAAEYLFEDASLTALGLAAVTVFLRAALPAPAPAVARRAGLFVLIAGAVSPLIEYLILGDSFTFLPFYLSWTTATAIDLFFGPKLGPVELPARPPLPRTASADGIFSETKTMVTEFIRQSQPKRYIHRASSAKNFHQLFDALDYVFGANLAIKFGRAWAEGLSLSERKALADAALIGDWAPPSLAEVNVSRMIDDIKQTPVFSLLSESPSDLTDFLRAARYWEGESVVEQGEPGDELFAIEEGRAGVYISAISGLETKVAELSAQDAFGEIALIEQAPRTATVRALEPLTCYLLDRAAFDAMLGEPQTRENLTRLIRTVSFMRRVPLLGALTAGELIAAGKMFEPDRAALGEAIITQGEDGDAFYLIEEGEVSVTVSEDQQTRELARLGPGSFFGELALLRNAPRMASVTAVSDCRLLVLRKTDFDNMISKFERLHDGLFAAAAKRLGEEIN